MELAGTELRHYTSGMITYCQTFNYIQKLFKLQKPLDVSQIYHFFDLIQYFSNTITFTVLSTITITNLVF